jgi:hypothetical protein
LYQIKQTKIKANNTCNEQEIKYLSNFRKAGYFLFITEEIKSFEFSKDKLKALVTVKGDVAKNKDK